jgi:hypothetical protein
MSDDWSNCKVMLMALNNGRHQSSKSNHDSNTTSGSGGREQVSMEFYACYEKLVLFVDHPLAITLGTASSRNGV